MDTDVDQQLRDYQREYLDFFDDNADQGIYNEKVKEMITKNRQRLIVNINDLRRKAPKRALRLLTNAHEELIACQQALKEFVISADTAYGKGNDEFFVGFEGSFGDKHVTPRSLTARHIGNLVCVEGIVTKCSLVRPKVVRSVHYCPATKKTMERKYTDLTSLDAFPSSSVYPTKDDQDNPLETEYGLSTYKDHQTLTIQEMPEKAPAGQLPRSVEIITDNDLVDNCKPGDRVQIIGTLRCLPSKKGSYTSGTFRTVLLANNISLLSKEVQPMFSASDVVKIRKFGRSKKHDPFDLLSHSLAPSIHGHEYIKKAVLCMLLGGVEKVLENGTRLRGYGVMYFVAKVLGSDINVLLIGDPSTAKSQMLRYVLHTAPRAITTTGRGSSGVGLTAAVTTDQETGERRLEAGAMVLADRGVVCIDEFDKMSDQDRTCIHEVMEQGRVTIAKAGIHATLNARCSVLAAANPVYGRYDEYKTPMENIGLQDSLLSRFDLIFIVLDTMDPDHDRLISDHVLRMHRYRTPGEQDGDALPLGSSVDFLATQDPLIEEKDEAEMVVYDKHDNLLHGNRKREKFVSMEFMRKYIHIAKLIKPVLTREAADCICDEYTKLRSQEQAANNVARYYYCEIDPAGDCPFLETLIRLATAHAKVRLSKTVDLRDAEGAIELIQFAIFKKTQPVTARSLETLIRLATAHAKVRLSKTVDLRDAEGAIELIQFAIFKKVLEKEKKKRKSDSDEELEEEEEQEQTQEARRKLRKKQKTDRPKKGEDGFDPYDFDSYEEDEDDTGVTLKSPGGSQLPAETPAELSEDRLKKFRVTIAKIFASQAESVPLAQVKKALAQDYPEDKFSAAEVDAAINIMQDANQVMFSSGMVYLI